MEKKGCFVGESEVPKNKGGRCLGVEGGHGGG